MNVETLVITVDTERHAINTICIGCGAVVKGPATETDWVPLAGILAAAEHTCRPSPWPSAPPTPRQDDTPMRAFVNETLEIDHKGVVSVDRLRDDWQARTGLTIYSGYFARRLRTALPPGVEIRREMINGVRARRIVGMRLRDQRT